MTVSPEVRRVATRVEEIASWAVRLSLDDVPGRARERARLQLANTIAAGRAGARATAVRGLRESCRAWASKGGATVVGERFKLEPGAAAYANAAASIAHDWDDYLFAGHTCHSAVWTSRAVGEAVGSTSDEMLTAQVAANEIAGRLGAALFIGPHNGQFWSSIHCASAAVAAGKLIGADEERLAHAIGISLYQPPYGLWPGFMGPDTKLLTAAEPTLQGIRAAQLAERGFSGPLDVIDSPRGLLTHLAFAPRPAMLGGLGETWLTETLAFKPYPGCAYLQSSVEGVLRLQEREAFGPEDVETVQVTAGYMTTGMEHLSEGPTLTPVRVNFSVALSVAVALTAGRLTHEELDAEALADREPQLRELAGRVRLEHDWALTLETVRGPIEAMPGGISDIPLSQLGSVRRRLKELNMDDLGVGLGDLREMLGDAEVRRALGVAVMDRFLDGTRGGREHGRGKGGESAAPLDAERVRMTFPARVGVRLRDGRMLETDGREPGSCGSPLSEQREVVSRKWALTGGRKPKLDELLAAE